MSRVIGANNILNAVFMVVASDPGERSPEAGLSIVELLLLTGLLNAFVAAYIYRLVPEFLLRFLAWLLVHFIYRLRDARHRAHSGHRPCPADLQSRRLRRCARHFRGVPRPVRFIMESEHLPHPVLSRSSAA
jgi:hypothetical protein